MNSISLHDSLDILFYENKFWGYKYGNIPENKLCFLFNISSPMRWFIKNRLFVVKILDYK